MLNGVMVVRHVQPNKIVSKLVFASMIKWNMEFICLYGAESTTKSVSQRIEILEITMRLIKNTDD